MWLYNYVIPSSVNYIKYLKFYHHWNLIHFLIRSWISPFPITRRVGFVPAVSERTTSGQQSKREYCVTLQWYVRWWRLPVHDPIMYAQYTRNRSNSRAIKYESKCFFERRARKSKNRIRVLRVETFSYHGVWCTLTTVQNNNVFMCVHVYSYDE